MVLKAIYQISLFEALFQGLQMDENHINFSKEWSMHLHVKHLGLGNRPHNVAVDYLVLRQINLLMSQMKKDAKFSQKISV